jgi:hypothetical protein
MICADKNANQTSHNVFTAYSNSSGSETEFNLCVEGLRKRLQVVGEGRDGVQLKSDAWQTRRIKAEVDRAGAEHSYFCGTGRVLKRQLVL